MLTQSRFLRRLAASLPVVLAVLMTSVATAPPALATGTAPAIEGESASVKATEATLNAQIDPEEQETTCEFEYGSEPLLKTGAKAEKCPSSLGKGSGGVGTSVTVTGLKADETYYYRALATNPTGTTVDPTIEHVTTVPVPFTDAVTGIGTTTATLNGHVTLNPLNTTVTAQFSFDYNPSATECVNGPRISAGEAAPGSGLVPEAKEVTELQPNATYSVCFETSNQYGSEVDPKPSLVQFKTLPAPPTFAGEAVPGVTPSSAVLEGAINPNNEKTAYYFEYSTSAAEILAGNGTKVQGAPPAAELGGYGVQGVDVATGSVLEPGVTYYYRVVATNGTPPATDGTVEHFTTQGKPLVSTGEAQHITRTTATLSGTVDPVGVGTTYYFAYIDQSGYEKALAGDAQEKANPYAEGETTAPINLGSWVYPEYGEPRFDFLLSYEPQAVGPVPASGMLPGTTYHYALVARNGVGMVIGADQTLRTLPPTPPTASTATASNVTQNGATITGAVTTNGLQTNYGFEIGTEPGNYGPATGLGSIGGANTEAISMTLGELQPGTTYYYRVTATNADGTSYGEPETFTTPGFPAGLSVPVSPPQIAIPTTAFPTNVTESATPTTKPKAKPKTKAQKLQNALKQCHRQPKKSRAKCERQARAKYGTTKSKGKK